MLDRYTHEAEKSSRELIHCLILFFLDHVDHLSEMCRLFRELWALATRDQTIQTLLDGHYRLLGEKLALRLESFSDNPNDVAKVVALLLPYFEGYSINGAALPRDKAQVAEMLTDLCAGMLEVDGSS